MGSQSPATAENAGQAEGKSPYADDATIIIFGASGDLTARKLMPALFALAQNGYVSERGPIVGVARRAKSDEEFRNEIREAVEKHAGLEGEQADAWERFAARLHYRGLDLATTEGYSELRSRVEALEQEAGTPPRRLVYLATAPELFLPSVEALAHSGMVPEKNSADEWLRVVFEKPFGQDLESAQELIQKTGRLLREEQIFRIDHYLGKETVQNILLFRFGNSIFEPLLNRNHVDHVQITVAESQGMESGRGGYYDTAGALRDVMQNHALQLLCLIAMEPPALFDSKDIHDEKLKVLKAVSPGTSGGVPQWAVSGQYVAGTIDGKKARGYLDEERIEADSRTETFVAMEVAIDNWRWAGVPFYLRTGKRLPHRVSEIAVQFKHPPLNLFTTVECEGDICDLVGARPNTLIFKIQPHESIRLSFSMKRPGMQYQIHPVAMDFSYDSFFKTELPEAYERLLLDVLRGDSTLFMRSDEVEESWRKVMPILEHWSKKKVVPEPYRAGSWGPRAAEELLGRTGRTWREPTGGPERNGG